MLKAQVKAVRTWLQEQTAAGMPKSILEDVRLAASSAEEMMQDLMSSAKAFTDAAK